jgi:hypothetical protein
MKQKTLLIYAVGIIVFLFVMCKFFEITDTYKNISIPTLQSSQSFQSDLKSLNDQDPGIPNISNGEEYGALGAPMIFLRQLYPRTPYSSDEGKPCEYGCGALGHCVNGSCTLKPYNKTVLDVEL